MVSCKQFVILALSGSAMAVPAVFKRDWKFGQGRWHGGGWGGDRTWSDVTYTTVTQEAPTTTEMPATYTAPDTYTAPAADATTITVTYDYAPAATTPTVQSVATSVVATASSVVASVSSSAPGASDTSLGDYMSIQTKWRQAGGLKPFIFDSQLQANALKTVTDSNGQMVHELNPGSMGQVLAPGSASDFEHVYVGGWLCEIPTLPGLNGICATQDAGWDHSSGETGHADILTSTGYTKIGCALYAGIWACDVA